MKKIIFNLAFLIIVFLTSVSALSVSLDSSSIISKEFSIDGNTYKIELISATDTSATIKVTLKSCPSSDTCTDSDGGKNYGVKGTSTLTSSNGTILQQIYAGIPQAMVWTDYCTNISNEILEYYCMNNLVYGQHQDRVIFSKNCCFVSEKHQAGNPH